MQFYELKPEIDNLIDTYQNDMIGRNKHIHSFVSLLSSLERECVIALDGQWGSGKTFFVKQAKMVIDATNPTTLFYKNDISKSIRRIWKEDNRSETNISPLITTYYDAWEHDNDEDPVNSLIYEILKEDYCVNKHIRKVKLLKIASSIASMCPGGSRIRDLLKNIENLKRQITGEDLFETIRKQDKLKCSIEDFFNSLLPEHGDRLVVFIDELDRCSPSYAVKLLERIKHFFSCPKLTFVFSVNLLELQETVKHYYGQNFDSCRYLDRFFDLTMQLPPPDPKMYFEKIAVFPNIDLRELVCFEVVNQMGMSMREADRFLRETKAAVSKYSSSIDVIGDLAKSIERPNRSVAKMIALNVITPIAVGLRKYNLKEYWEFIRGENSFWLERVAMVERINDIVMPFLYPPKTIGFSGVRTHEEDIRLIRELYNAVFVKNYDAFNEDRTMIGSVLVSRDIKNIIVEVVGLFSSFSEYG